MRTFFIQIGHFKKQLEVACRCKVLVVRVPLGRVPLVRQCLIAEGILGVSERALSRSYKLDGADRSRLDSLVIISGF